jgi:hypothetical protein
MGIGSRRSNHIGKHYNTLVGYSPSQSYLVQQRFMLLPSFEQHPTSTGLFVLSLLLNLDLLLQWSANPSVVP